MNYTLIISNSWGKNDIDMNMQFIFQLISFYQWTVSYMQVHLFTVNTKIQKQFTVSTY